MNATSNNSHPRAEPPARATHFQHDWDGDESLSAAVVSTVADLSETDPVELELIYDHVNPDSLNELFRPGNDDVQRNNGHLWFPLHGYGVTVYGDGFVTVRRLE